MTIVTAMVIRQAYTLSLLALSATMVYRRTIPKVAHQHWLSHTVEDRTGRKGKIK